MGCSGGVLGVVHNLLTREIYLSGVESRSNPVHVDLATPTVVDNSHPGQTGRLEPLPSRRRAQRGTPAATPAPPTYQPRPAPPPRLTRPAPGRSVPTPTSPHALEPAFLPPAGPTETAATIYAWFY